MFTLVTSSSVPVFTAQRYEPHVPPFITYEVDALEHVTAPPPPSPAPLLLPPLLLPLLASPPPSSPLLTLELDDPPHP